MAKTLLDKPLSDKDFTKEFKRFQTKDKAKAFHIMQDLEKDEKIVFAGIIERDGKRYRQYKKTSWRTSMNFSDRIAFDVDSHDKLNLSAILNYYEGLFKKTFNIVVSKHGYHLIMKGSYDSHVEWQYNACRVLYPFLEREQLQKYISAVERFYSERKQERDKKELSRKELQDLTKDFEEKFRLSGLYCGVGNFEILFAVNAIMRDFYSLRISKKDKSDKAFLYNP